MPPSRIVETISWGMSCMSGELTTPRGVATDRPAAPGALLPLVPPAERDPLGAIRRELLGPHGNELPVLPLQHVVLHASVRVLARVVELHAPAVDGGADRQVHAHDRGAELVEVVGLRRVERELQDPETAARELVPAGQYVGAGLGLHGVAECLF